VPRLVTSPGAAALLSEAARRSDAVGRAALPEDSGAVALAATDAWREMDGTRYSWRDGECMVFDETYVHCVENGTDMRRIILFCDIDRPLRQPMA